MIELIKLIDVIVGFASPVVQNKLQRNELVIKLLKQLNLDPDHPPTDFTAVYQYTLVEYGIGKPKPVLEIFRQLEIQAIFRKALDRNNSALLLQEGERFLSSHALGEQIRELGIDAKREFYQFAAIFIEVAKRTRTPAEVLTNQRLESLHQQIGTVQERLTRLPTLEGMRTEMARLAAQSLALPAAESQDQQCRAFALAQQMKGWFETLGYRFETHEVWQNDYFEWVINIPVRRGRYDRILVRGMEGAAEIGDVGMLRQSVEQQRTDEGWLVTTRRISRSARTEVEKPENAHLGCYTFDELLDQDADFSGYLSWLEAEIQQRQIEQKYVPLACTKEELDPVTQQRIAVSRYDDRDGWIDGYIDQWLDDPAKEHISVLGEFGTGKTWFALHYAWVALQRYRDAQKRGVDRPRLPLVIPLRDYAKAVSVESLFSEFFFRKHEIPIPGYSAFEQLNRMGKLLLIFDGFDEMAARVDRQEMINNFWELAKIVVPGAKVILTCRTEHFPEVKEGRALLNAELKASTINLNEDTPQFEVLELEKFDDEQIRQVLAVQASPEVVQQVMNNAQLLDLARRPVMTELILEALPDIEAGKPVDMSRVYLYAVRRKMERDIKEERTFTSLADKLYFLCELSWEMLSSDRMSLNYREFPDRIRRLFGSVVQEEKDLDHWHYDMMGQTMLIRNADGDYMPAHRSLLEFFVAYKLAAELGVLSPDFLELVQEQSYLDNNAEPQDYLWSSYFIREIYEGRSFKSKAGLLKFVPEEMNKLVETLGAKRLTKAVLDLLKNMIWKDRKAVIDHILALVLLTRNKSTEEVNLIGRNLVTLLLKLNPKAIQGVDLSSTNLNNIDFTMRGYKDMQEYGNKIIFSKSIFQYTNLKNATFGFESLSGVDFQYSDLTGAKFTLNQFDDASLHPKKSQLVVSSVNDLMLWNLESNSLTMRVNTRGSWHIEHSPDGEFIVNTISGGFEIRDPQTLDIISTHKNSETVINSEHNEKNNLWTSSFTFTSDSRTLFVGCNNSAIYVWNFVEREETDTLVRHSSSIKSIAISPDGRFLASSSYAELIVWDIATLSPLAEKRWNSINFGNSLFHPNGMLLAIETEGEGILHLNSSSLETIDIHPIKDAKRMCFSSDGSKICLAGWNWLKILDFSTKECLFSYEFKHLEKSRNFSPEKICFDERDQLFLIAGKNGEVITFDAIDGKVSHIIRHLPEVLNANFRHTTGIDSSLMDHLKAHGAII